MIAMQKIALLALVSALALPCVSFAQAATVTPPAHKCVKPTLPAGNKPLNKAQADKLNAENGAYQGCQRAYHDARKAVVDEYSAIAQAHAKAAQALDLEFNNYLDLLNADIAARDKAAKDSQE